ncbi:MAG: helix-turn-helix transcriptional regulator [Mycolicibacterium vanbaalenii]|uniref:helix-turn-helix domain-containing protein n=1 Tax=Mycolicibacterium vanbaalenii TaxID=110539 RepID=UPI003564C9DE
MADQDGVAEQLRARERSFAEQMKERRLAKGLSQTELAKVIARQGLKFHQTTVARIEDGEQPLKLVEALAIAGVLDLDLRQFVQVDPAIRFDQLANAMQERLAAAHGPLVGAATHINMIAKLLDQHPELLGTMRFPGDRQPRSTAEYLELLGAGFNEAKPAWNLAADHETGRLILEALASFARNVATVDGGSDAET